MERFLFGQPVKRVQQTERTHKKYFILGVYASAVHAKWISDKGKTLINALAVASEPYIFWRGDCAEAIINCIELPSRVGKLLVADKKFNGPSGNALDVEYLQPLGITRDDCWLCDLVPYSMMNAGQLAAIERNQKLLNETGISLPTIREATTANRKISEERKEEILGEVKESGAEYVITLGNEPIKNFIQKYCPQISLLSKTVPYGKPVAIKLADKDMNLIRLVHPRQAAKLGTHGPEWHQIHQTWESSHI